jgi:hypothetical protein
MILIRSIDTTPGNPSRPATAMLQPLRAINTPVNVQVRSTAASAANPAAAPTMSFLKAPGERISRIIRPQASAEAAMIKYVLIIYLHAAGGGA